MPLVVVGIKPIRGEAGVVEIEPIRGSKEKQLKSNQNEAAKRRKQTGDCRLGRPVPADRPGTREVLCAKMAAFLLLLNKVRGHIYIHVC